VLGLTSLIEQHCNVTATTRNWNTVTRLTRLIGT